MGLGAGHEAVEYFDRLRIGVLGRIGGTETVDIFGQVREEIAIHKPDQTIPV
jgi:hypothetical protein